jgi:hypothetical protein
MTILTALLLGLWVGDDPLPPLPKGATLVLDESWSTGKIDPERWYRPRKRWGQGNSGVIPENVRVEREGTRYLLVCEAQGDLYDGPRVGFEGRKDRVGGVIVSKEFFASGRFEIAFRLGTPRPAGAVPAVWTYGYRYVSVGRDRMKEFVAEEPLYNPLMERYKDGTNEYWSELDFPEFGKGGVFEKALYNAYCQTQEDSRAVDVAPVTDGRFHTLSTEWRTELAPLEGVQDAQVVEASGFWWVKDRAIPFDRYAGNPLKRLGADRYLVFRGVKAEHWVDGKKVGENTQAIPCMAAQLTLGIWLPGWGGPAAWKTSTVAFGPVRVWQYRDPGDVRGILTGDVKDNFDPEGRPLR